MSDHESSDHDPLEAALRRLTPTPPAFAKDRLVFLAGQASGQRARLRLAFMAALAGVGIGVIGGYLGLRAAMPADAPPQVVVIHVPVPAADVPPAPVPHEKQEPKPAPPQESPSRGWDPYFEFDRPANGYLHLRDQVLRWGVEAMPTATPTATAGPAPRPSNLQEMQSELVGKASEF